MEQGETRPKKARMSKSKVKSLLIAFFDIKGVVHHEYVPAGQTINVVFYIQVLERLRARVFCVQLELAQNGYALTHRSLAVCEFLAHNSISTVPHPLQPRFGSVQLLFIPPAEILLKRESL
ncbi:hypothetical protein PGB90_005013 [Kerria lacca]